MGTTLYRAMKSDTDGLPVCEDTARGLGVRVPPHPKPDILPDADGRVQPRTGGMSVTPDDPARMNPMRRPRKLGGTGKDPVFFLATLHLGGPLAFRRDPDDPTTHGFVEPVELMSLMDYQRDLSATRPAWRLW